MKVINTAIYAPSIKARYKTPLSKENNMSAQLIRTILEILYFLCAPIIAFAAVIGLRQLNILKEVSRISAKRESYRLAAEQCKYFAEIIIPLLVQIKNEISKNGINYFNQVKIIINSDSVSCDLHAIDSNEIDKVIKLVNLIRECSNRMEAFALFIISGVADEQISFMTVGKSFCDCSRILIPFIFLVHKSLDNIEPIIKLFRLWNNKIEKQHLVNEKVEIEHRINKIQVKSIQPIGT
jgi:hypothetical protein